MAHPEGRLQPLLDPACRHIRRCYLRAIVGAARYTGSMTTHTENLRKISAQLVSVTDAMKAIHEQVRSLAPVIKQIGEQLQEEQAKPEPQPIQSPMDLIQAFKRLSENPTPNTARRQQTIADVKAAFAQPLVTTPSEATKATAAASFVNVQTIPGRNLTDQARHLLRNGHSYNDAIQLLQLAHPSKTREHVRRAAGRARDTK